MTERYKNTNRTLKFFLQNASQGTIELYHAPDGWDESGYSYSRSSTYGGVFRKYAIDKLGFVKEGKKFIEDVIESQGFEAEISVIITEKDYSDYSSFQLFSGKLQIVDKDSDRIKINVPLVDSSFEDKLINREDVNIIVTKRKETETYTDLDGGEILGFSNEKRLLTLPERIDFLSSIMTSDRDLAYVGKEDNSPNVPLLLKGASEDPNIKGNTNDYKLVAGAFYVNNTNADASIELNGTVNLRVVIDTDLYTTSDIKVNLLIIDNTDVITKTISVPVTITEPESLRRPVDGEYLVIGEINITDIVPKDSYIQFSVMRDGATSQIAKGAIIDFSIRTQSDVSEQANIETTLIHEAFARIGQKITGSNNPFYSSLFGRKNSEPRSYDFDGKDSLLAITNGALLRGFPMTNSATLNETIAPLSISLKDLFNACSVKRPLGMGIETVDGKKVFRIEELSYFFDTRIALTVDNATDITEDYNKKEIQNEFEAGYTKFETDEIRDGFFDSNTKSKWANAITTVKNKLSVISKYSASNASINKARSVELSRENKPTTDSKYDDINFLIDAVENQAGNFVLNPNAESGTANWSITTGVSTQSLIGNEKFVLIEPVDDVQVRMSQQLAAISTPVFTFSYAITSENGLTFTPRATLKAVLNDTSIKSLNSNGDWVDGESSFSVPSIIGVQESQLQSMTKFNIAAKEKLEDINYIEISFDTDFIGDETGTNRYILDDIYVSDSAEYKARTTEGFDSITGIVNPNDSYNILLSPARTLRRWGYVLRASLEDKLNTLFTFADTEKNSTLVSKVTSEDYSVAEGENVLVNDLGEPLWGIEKISFDALLSAAQRKDINLVFDDGKPKILGIVAYRRNTSESYNYGWIDDLNLGGLDGLAKLEIRPISKYIDVAEDVIAVDDDEAIFTDDDESEFIIE